jgi:hypothetical protein
MPDQSIYDDNRLALPDEVWNFMRGDGIEKAFLLADFIMHSAPEANVIIDIAHKHISLRHKDKVFQFSSHKNLKKKIEINGRNYLTD